MKLWHCVALSLTVLVLVPSGTVQAATIHVPADQPTIAAGLAAAAAGDSVLVATGTYHEHDLVVGSGVTLSGESASAAGVVIDAQSAGRVLLVSNAAEPVRIENLSLCHGEASAGGGLNIFGSVVFLDNCHVDGNSASSWGGGVSCVESNLTVTHCLFTDNHTTGDGGGLDSYDSDLSLADCVFEGNSGYFGGALVLGSGAPSVLGCRFTGNESQGAGGAISTSGGATPSISHCLFEGNSAAQGGAYYANLTSDSYFEYCTFVDNSANQSGANLHAWMSTCVLDHCILANCTLGTVVQCQDTAEIHASCCDIYGNFGGDWVGCLAGQLGKNGNISEDPLFCLDENPAEPYSVNRESACAEINNPDCGQIGAFVIGCGLTGVERRSWSQVKSLY